MKKYLLLLFPVVIFFLLKFQNISIVRLSDTTIYFYTAYTLTKGSWLYKDIFFTNFPLFPYLSALYFSLVWGNLSLYFFTATFEVITTAIFLFIISKIQSNNIFYAYLTSLAYLFSFFILSTSDHQTGVFIASLFAILSYYAFIKDKFFLTGFFLALMLMMKAYFIVIVLSFITFCILTKRYRYGMHLFISFFITTILILLPFLLFTRDELIHDIFFYSLTRAQGVSKMDIATFFVTKDPLLLILFFFSLLNSKKEKLLGLISFFSLLIFILYKDMYYLYLNFIVPFLCLSLPSLLLQVRKKLQLQILVLPTFLLIIFVWNIFVYTTSYSTLQKLPNFLSIAKQIEKLNPNYLYGTNDITPAFSYITKIPLLNGVIDTNETIFKKGLLNKNGLTSDAIRKKSVLILHGVWYPSAGIRQNIMDGIVDQKLVSKSCRLEESYPVYTEGIINRLNLFSCF